MERYDDLKTIKSLLLLGAGAFLLALTTSVTATYAWFELTNAQKVAEIGMKVEQGSPLEIGLKRNLGDTIDYYEAIGDKELSEHFPSYSPGAKLSPVSGMNLGDWYNQDTDLSRAFPELYSLSPGIASPIRTSQGYICFEAYFRSAQPGYLFLEKEGTKIVPEKEINRETEAYYGLSEGSLDKVVDCVRVSFLSNEGYYILDLEKEGDTAFSGRLDLNGDGYYDSLDGQEIVYGQYTGEPVFGESLQSDLDNEEGEPKTSSGIRPFLEAESKANGYAPAIEPAYPLDAFCLKENEPSFDPTRQFPLAYLSADEPTRVVISLYLEGWDKDADESVVDGTFSLDLCFTCLYQNRK